MPGGFLKLPNYAYNQGSQSAALYIAYIFHLSQPFAFLITVPTIMGFFRIQFPVNVLMNRATTACG